MAQNRKKGMAKRALSVSLVAAMLATSNTPAWASGFVNENEDGVQAFFDEISNEEVVAEEDVVVTAFDETGFDRTGIETFATNSLADDDSVKWFDADALKTILTAADAVNAVGDKFNKGTIEIGFVNGSVTDGKVDEGSNYTVWNEGSDLKAQIGNKIAVGFHAVSQDTSADSVYYVTDGAEVKAAEKTDITKAVMTINGKTFEATSTGWTPNTIDYDVNGYEITSAKVTLSNGKEISLDGDDNVDLSTELAAENGIGETAAPTITFGKNNRAGFKTNEKFTPAETLAISGNKLTDLVEFTAGNLTYDAQDLVAPTGTVDYGATCDALKKLVKVDSKIATAEYTIDVYKNAQGTSQYGSGEVLEAGQVYLGVNVTGAYNGTIKSKVPTTIAKKNIGDFFVDEATLAKEDYDSTSPYGEAEVKSALAKAVYYSKEKPAPYDNIANDTGLNFKISGFATTGAQPNDTITVVISPADGKNYSGSKTITYQLKADDADLADAKTALETALGNLNLTYDAKYHAVNDLIKADLDVLKRADYKLTSMDANKNGNIKDAGSYRIALEVVNGPFKGITIPADTDTTVEIAKRNVDVFENGVGVKANTITFDPDRATADLVKELGLTLSYNNETLRYGVDYTIALNPGVTTVNANDDILIDIAAVDGNGASNYMGTVTDVKVGTIQKKKLSEVDLPELPVQAYKTGVWALADLKGVNANGDTVAYTTVLNDGKKNDYNLVRNSCIKATLKPPVNGMGAGVLTLTGTKNYTGTVVKNFTVASSEITADIGTMTNNVFTNVIAPQTYDYTAMQATESKGVELPFEATAAQGIIVRDKTTGDNVTDKCVFTYTNNTAVGTATVEAKGKAGYDIYAVATFTIQPKQITSDSTGNTDAINNAAIANIDAVNYKGEAITPVVKLVDKADIAATAPVALKDGAYTLKEGVDYKVEYTNNVNVAAFDSATNAPTVTVTGLGNYVFNEIAAADHKTNTGIKTTFTISAVTIGKANLSVKDVVYAGGLEVAPNITIVNPETGKELVKDTDYTVIVKNGVNAGVADAEITLKSYDGATGYNYLWDSRLVSTPADDHTITVNFQITKKALADCDVKIVGGKVVVKNGELTVPETEYTVTENEDGNFTVKAAEKNYTGEVTVSATAAPAATQAKIASKTTSSVKVAWDAVDGAEGYTIWYHSEKDTANTRKIITGGDITSWTHKGLAAGTKYFYTVKAWVKDAEGKYVFGEETSYVRGTTMPMKAKIAKVTAANGMVKVALADAAAGAEKYSMCYSKSSDFASFKVGVRTSYTTRTFTNALTKGTYYVRVKSYRDLGNNKRIYGAWSNTVKVVVK